MVIYMFGNVSITSSQILSELQITSPVFSVTLLSGATVPLFTATDANPVSENLGSFSFDCVFKHLIFGLGVNEFIITNTAMQAEFPISATLEASIAATIKAYITAQGFGSNIALLSSINIFPTYAAAGGTRRSTATQVNVALTAPIVSNVFTLPPLLFSNFTYNGILSTVQSNAFPSCSFSYTALFVEPSNFLYQCHLWRCCWHSQQCLDLRRTFNHRKQLPMCFWGKLHSTSGQATSFSIPPSSSTTSPEQMTKLFLLA